MQNKTSLKFYGITKNPETKEFMMVTDNHKKCSPWCKECVPYCVIEGWTSGNAKIDEFIKDTIYNADYINGNDYYPIFLEWVPFNRFKDIKQIGESGFSKEYFATWIDGKL